MDIAVYVMIAVLIVFMQYLKEHWVSKRLLKKAKRKLVIPDSWEVLEVVREHNDVMVVRRLAPVRKLKRYYTNRLFITLNHNRKNKKQQASINELEDSLFNRFTKTKEGVLAMTVNDPQCKDFVVYYNENVDLSTYLEELVKTYEALQLHIEIDYDPFWKAYATFNKQMKNAKK